jgi:hypothetical protein
VCAPHERRHLAPWAQEAERTNVGSDRAQLAAMAKAAKAVLRAERLDAVADRGYFNSEEILACEQRGSR